MRFNPKARIDQSQIENRTGGGGGGLGGGRMQLPIPGGGGGKLGLGGILVVIVIALISQFSGNGLLGPLDSEGGGSSTTTDDNCRTGEDANNSESCTIDLVTNSVQAYWEKAYPAEMNRDYQVIKTVKFSGSTTSGCGQASSEMGPFYCPNDERVYLDTAFFKDMLEGQLGAKGGPFAIAYVIAHEYGHHIENQLEILGQIRTQQGANSDSVKVELMADCLAGAWAKNAQSTKDEQGVQIISDLTQDDIARAIDSAEAVGDDRIQKRSSGRSNPDTFTHGSSAQRVRWFNIGLDQGTISACNTFEAGRL